MGLSVSVWRVVVLRWADVYAYNISVKEAFTHVSLLLETTLRHRRDEKLVDELKLMVDLSLLLCVVSTPPESGLKLANAEMGANIV